jgi:hypothetical protein
LNLLRWLVPALTAATLINLSVFSDHWLKGWGIGLGLFYGLAAIMGAWELYVRNQTKRGG